MQVNHSNGLNSYHFSKKISIRWRTLITGLLLIEAVPYLFSFGINWPYEWPRQSRKDVPHHEWCYPGGIFLSKEFNVCGKQNSEGRWDLEFSPQPGPGVYRAAYLGNSHVEAQSIPLHQKASKVAQKTLNQTIKTAHFEIMDFYASAMAAPRIFLYTIQERKKHGVQHVILKSMGVDSELQPVASASKSPPPPVHLYQNGFLQRLIHVPFSNLLSFLAWNGLKFYVELYNPEAVQASEPPPSQEREEWIRSHCQINSPKMIQRLAVYAQGIERSYLEMVQQGALENERLTIVQIPPRKILVRVDHLQRKFENCQIQIHQTGFERIFGHGKSVNLVDVTPLLEAHQVHVADIYFPADHHLNELGNQLVGEAIAQGIKWYF